MKYFLALCLMSLSLPLFAQATVSQGAFIDPVGTETFPMEVEVQAQGMNIDAETHNLGNVVSVTLTNRGEQPVECTATFNNGPEIAGPVRVRIAPGEQVEATETLRQSAIIVRVDVACERA